MAPARGSVISIALAANHADKRLGVGHGVEANVQRAALAPSRGLGVITLGIQCCQSTRVGQEPRRRVVCHTGVLVVFVNVEAHPLLVRLVILKDGPLFAARCPGPHVGGVADEEPVGRVLEPLLDVPRNRALDGACSLIFRHCSRGWTEAAEPSCRVG